MEYTLQSGVTLKVASKGEWWTYNDIFVNREYDLPIQTALQSRSPEHPFTVLDLGANVGYFTLRVVDLMRQSSLETLASDMTLVEGSPTTFRELQDRLRLQSLSLLDLRVIHGLVGEREGNGVIHESALHVKNTIMDTGQHDGVRVNFVDLYQIMENRSKIDLLKCDVEGAELSFIENYGDLLRRVKNAVFEFHHEQCDTATCVDLLEQLGFHQRVLRSCNAFSICFFSKN
ncbi:MAG TPA: FkbM family methyltransferase [Terriglobales bacterium]|nr:FkbM family methyltransferase [Terriglobales bacterium]